MVLKAVIFDIGGVVVRSPMLAIAAYEKEHGLPPNYINSIIASQGPHGAFQKFERGEMSLFSFYDAFSTELSDSKSGNTWYEAYCNRRGLACPPLPAHLQVDGRELFGRMMRESKIYDELIVEAIRRIRKSGKYRVIALTNNFSKSDDTILRDAPRDANFSLHKELEFLGWQDGVTPAPLRALFDDFCDSSTFGLRKPDPAFYLLACERNSIHPDEAVFLDDIGYNLRAARELGMQTIQVTINGSLRALKQLEKLLGLDLTSGNNDFRQTAHTKL